MTRAKDRLVLTHVEERNGRPSEGHRFLDEMGIVPSQAHVSSPDATSAIARAAGDRVGAENVLF